MDLDHRVETPHDVRRAAEHRPARHAAVERIAALATMAAIVAVLVNYVGAHLTFFGAPVVIDAEDVRNYWISVSVLGVSVAASFVAAARRGATKSFVWHSVMGLIGLVVALGFAVTETGPPERQQPEPAPAGPAGSACHSGGDSTGCVGG